MRGRLWAWLAPPIHSVVALTRSNDRVKAYLGYEGDHFFTAAFLMVGFLSVLAVIAAVAVWQWRTPARTGDDGRPRRGLRRGVGRRGRHRRRCSRDSATGTSMWRRWTSPSRTG